MGSINDALIVGVVCRLCSTGHDKIIHLFSERAIKLRLLEKINEYLPITITLDDPLPKTICEGCLNKIEEQHKLMQQISRVLGRNTTSQLSNNIGKCRF